MTDLRGAVPTKLEMDYSRILKKPYFLKEISWTTNAVDWNPIATLSIPSDLWSNDLTTVPFRASVYYRAKISIIAQVSGSPMHSGCLFLAAMPKHWNRRTGSSYFPINTNAYMAAPHCFLNANECTTAILPVPFYVQGHLASIDLSLTTISPYNIDDDYSVVYIMPASKLVPPSSATAVLKIMLSVVFEELEFYIPHVDPVWEAQGYGESVTRFIDGIFSAGKRFTGDFLDNVRGTIREWTGLHAPECPALESRHAVQFRQNMNLVDTPSYFEKMDPFGQFVPMVDDCLFNSEVDEMELSHILSKPQFVGKFSITSDTIASGKLLFSRPITPIQQFVDVVYKDEKNVEQRSTGWSNLMQTFAYMSCYWRGTIKLHLQPIMSSTQFVRLAIARDYSPDKNMPTKSPAFSSIFNLMTEIIEFSGGGQIQTVDLPFCSPLDRLPCSFDWVYNALQHGMYYIYLNAPASGALSNYPISFNVYISAGDDFQFYGYSVNPLLCVLSDTEGPSVETQGNELVDLPTVKKGFNEIDEIMSMLSDSVLARSSNLTQFDTSSSFVAQANAILAPNDASDLLNDKEAPEPSYKHVLRPIKSVRDFARRLVPLKRFVLDLPYLDSTGGIFQIQIGTLLGLNPKYDTSTIGTGFVPIDDVSPLAIFSKMFMGYKGGLKLKVVINGTTMAKAWYVPPTTTIDLDNSEWTGTQPVPPPASTLFDPISELFQVTSNTNQPGYATGYNGSRFCNTVSVERPNYLNNVANNYNSVTDERIISNDCCEFEFMIPYFTAYNFVGNALSQSRTKFASDLEKTVNDLGNLVIDLNQVYSVIGKDTAFKVYQNQLSLDIYGAITDEGRFGFQTMAPMLVLPSVTWLSTTPPGTLYVQRLPNYSNISGRTPLTRPKPALGTGAPACYINV